MGPHFICIAEEVRWYHRHQERQWCFPVLGGQKNIRLIIKYWEVCLDLGSPSECITPCFAFKLLVQKTMVSRSSSKLKMKRLKRRCQNGQMCLHLIRCFLTLFIVNPKFMPLFSVFIPFLFMYTLYSQGFICISTTLVFHSCI